MISRRIVKKGKVRQVPKTIHIHKLPTPVKEEIWTPKKERAVDSKKEFNLTPAF